MAHEQSLKRINKLQKSLKQFACDALMIDDKTNLFYLTGLNLSAGKLLIGADFAFLFVDGRYFETCQQHSPVPVKSLDKPPFEKIFSESEFQHIKTLGFDSDKTSYKAFQQLSTTLAPLQLVALESPLQSLRAIKDATEIELLRQAADLGSQGYDFVCSILKEGISESEVAIELEIFWKKRGAKGLAFDPIIAFGPNASMPHYRAGQTKLQPNQAVLIDIGVNLNHYHSDMTRMAFFGTPDPKIQEIYDNVKKAQKAALALCKPQTSLADLDEAARSIIAECGYGDQFTHSLGHGVGLDIHEYPLIKNTPLAKKTVLQEGMVVTIEPGIYLPGLGGVRLEDTVVITCGGHENLTKRPL